MQPKAYDMKEYYDRMIEHYTRLEAVYLATGNDQMATAVQVKRGQLESEYSLRWGNESADERAGEK